MGVVGDEVCPTSNRNRTRRLKKKKKNRNRKSEESCAVRCARALNGTHIRRRCPCPNNPTGNIDRPHAGAIPIDEPNPLFAGKDVWRQLRREPPRCRAGQVSLPHLPHAPYPALACSSRLATHRGVLFVCYLVCYVFCSIGAAFLLRYILSIFVQLINSNFYN